MILYHCLISNLLPLLVAFEIMVHLTIDGDMDMKKSRIYWLFKIHQLLCLFVPSFSFHKDWASTMFRAVFLLLDIQSEQNRQRLCSCGIIRLLEETDSK